MTAVRAGYATTLATPHLPCTTWQHDDTTWNFTCAVNPGQPFQRRPLFIELNDVAGSYLPTWHHIEYQVHSFCIMTRMPRAHA